MTTFSFMAPTAPWSINQERSKHWSWRSTRAAAWRTVAWAAVQRAGIGPQPPAIVKVTLPFDRGARRDPHNFIGPVKALVDGLVDAGLWDDDSPKYVIVAEPELVIGNGGWVHVEVVPR